MAGSYYEQARTKRLLEIATADTSDDTLLDELGLVADQHIDNILLKHDEKIPLTGANITNEVKQMAALWTAHLYKKKRGDDTTAKVFKETFEELEQGFGEHRGYESKSYVVERHNSRYQSGIEHVLRLWN